MKRFSLVMRMKSNKFITRFFFVFWTHRRYQGGCARVWDYLFVWMRDFFSSSISFTSHICVFVCGVCMCVCVCVALCHALYTVHRNVRSSGEIWIFFLHRRFIKLNGFHLNELAPIIMRFSTRIQLYLSWPLKNADIRNFASKVCTHILITKKK